MNTIHRRLLGLTLTGLFCAFLVLPSLAAADPTVTGTTNTVLPSRISATDPLNGGFLLANMHGMLFHPATGDVAEDLAYARWLGAGVIRVFAVDSNGTHPWNGTRVGQRIAEIAPMLRAAHLRLIVAFVNNHQAVPGEVSGSAGWMDNYMQLLLPFYTNNWRGAYRQFVHDLITTVQASSAQDVIYAWELGNELHTPAEPDALIPFISADAADVRALDPVTPILPGTMGANHVEPGRTDSTIARWLYCSAPVDAYTLHAYDWVSRQRPGDMPIDWDLDNILSQPCPNGRALPVIVEELGTSRALDGMYTADDEAERLDQEKRQIEFVRHFPEVVGFGVWNAESPRLVDRTFVDTRRGLTSYGNGAQGGGSCYDPLPDPSPGARCELEQVLRDARFVRVSPSNQWTAGPSGEGASLIGSVDPVYSGDSNSDELTISGWVADPSTADWSGIDALNIFLGNGLNASSLPVLGASAQMGLKRDDVASSTDNPAWVDSGFSINLPMNDLPVGPTVLTLAAHTPERGTWVSSLAVVVPDLGAIPARASAPVGPVPVVAPLPPFHAEVAAPQVGDQVSRSSIVEVLAPTADHVEVYLEPDRDRGGRLVGSTTVAPGLAHTTVKVTVNAPLGAHTLYVHVDSSLTGQEAVISVPVVVAR